MKKYILLLPFLYLSGLGLASPAAENFGADRHVQNGLTCESCHGKNKEIEYPTIQQCKTCHDPVSLKERTANSKPRNPHISPHYGTDLDCALCHTQHDKPVNYCNQCHQFNFQVK